MLMSTDNRRVHRHRPVDRSDGVRAGEKSLKDMVPGAVTSQASMPGPDRLPRTEYLWYIAPGDPTPVAVDNAFDHRSGIGEGTTTPAGPDGEQIRDRGPLRVRERLESSHPDIIDPNTRFAPRGD